MRELEVSVLSTVPGYHYMKQVGASMLGVSSIAKTSRAACRFVRPRSRFSSTSDPTNCVPWPEKSSVLSNRFMRGCARTRSTAHRFDPSCIFLPVSVPSSLIRIGT